MRNGIYKKLPELVLTYISIKFWNINNSIVNSRLNFIYNPISYVLINRNYKKFIKKDIKKFLGGSHE